MIKLLTWGLLLAVTVCELVLLSKQHTKHSIYKSYQEQLERNQMTNKVIQKQLVFNKEQHWCYLPIANSLVPSPSIQSEQGDFESNSIYLKPLESLCATYRTKEFIYKLCYGKEVRQLDDEITKSNMGKPEFQNFLLGRQPPKGSVQSGQDKPLHKEFIQIKNRIGRVTFKFSIDFFTTEGAKRFGLMSLFCKNSNSTVQLPIMWIGESDFLVLEEFSDECLAFEIGYEQLSHERITKNQKELSDYLNTFYQLVPAASQLIVMKNKSVEIVNPTFVSEYYIRLEDPSISPEDVRSMLVLDFSEQITDRISFKDLFDLKLKDRVVVVDVDLLVKKLTLTNTNPLQFSEKIKLEPERVAGIFRVENRKSKNVTIPVSSYPITFMRLETGDVLHDVDSSQCISVESVAGKVIRLIQEDGWEYYLRNDGTSFRSRTNKFNYSKEMENQNEYFANITSNGFLICGGIWGTDDLETTAEQFYRLPISGKYRLLSDTPVFIRVYNLQHEFGKLKQPQSATISPPTGLHISQFYKNGDRCSDTLQRSTEVTYYCGDSWFSIDDIEQSQICKYQITVHTRLLCPFGSSFNQVQEQNKDTVCFNERMYIL